MTASAEAPEVPGSWWLDWDLWKERSTGTTAAPTKLGNKTYRPIEPAPGRSVKIRTASARMWGRQPIGESHERGRYRFSRTHTGRQLQRRVRQHAGARTRQGGDHG